MKLEDYEDLEDLNKVACGRIIIEGMEFVESKGLDPMSEKGNEALCTYILNYVFENAREIFENILKAHEAKP